VAARLKELAFRSAMNDLFRSLEQGDYTRAEQALTRAREIAPQAKELPEAATQLTQARSNAQLRRLRSQATNAAKNEQWQSAAELYKKALQLDPAATFARSGLSEAEKLIALHKRLRHYIEQPDRLQTPQVLHNAKAVLKASETVDQPGPKLHQERETLKALINAAQQPVTVHLFSDGLTHVVLYRVGRLGRFTRRELSLNPGSYTLVGSRDGYRDVRRVFKVSPESSELEITIRCEEAI
jgi:tetratricopeptide (TPR) repeat protein